MTSHQAAIRQMLIAGGLLLAFTLLGVGLVAVTYDSTREQVEENRRAHVLRQLGAVVPPGTYNNEPVDDVMKASDPALLGTNRLLPVYRLRKDGEPVATVITAVAPDGYSGDIVLLIGIDTDGVISGVRVASHRETPGLGDAIERSRSNWIMQFEGLTLEPLVDEDNDNNEQQAPDWRLRRDGGDFDQISGATVTARAVVSAIHNALQFHQQYHELLFADAATLDDARAQQEAEQAALQEGLPDLTEEPAIEPEPEPEPEPAEEPDTEETEETDDDDAS